MARSGAPPASAAVAHLGRYVLDFRLISVLLTVLHFPFAAEAVPGLQIAIVLAALASLVPLLRWERLSPWLMRHPTALLVDVVAAVGILLFTGPEGPFLYYTLGTAFLAGVLYGWVGGLLFSCTLVLGYAYVVSVNLVVRDLALDFQLVVAVPALYLLAGAGAAAVRGLLLGKAEAEAEARTALHAAAVAGERARLAREMHDTLGKTLHGIALAAAALPRWVERRPERAVEQAASVARAAETAAAQARELIRDLRSDRLDAPLHEAVEAHVREWSASTATPVRCVAEPVEGISPGPRYELLCILKEALRNVERHADADAVEVELRGADGSVELVVRDDGVGPPPLDADALAAAGHYGFVGMQERARRAGGDVALGPGRDGRGTQLTVVVAARSAADMVPLEPLRTEVGR